MRPIHKGDHVYPNGCIQSLATQMNGIVTSDDASRPDTFFAMYDGQVGLRGLGVNFHACSANDQDFLTNDPDNNIYRMVDGTICQWSIRARTFKGVGNGDWSDINSSTSNILGFDGIKTRVNAQGILNGVDPLTSLGGSYGFFPASNIYANHSDHGIYKNYQTSRSYNGECYLYVIATVPRLNQGAYHPSFNPLGVAGWREVVSGKTTQNIGRWNSSDSYKGASVVTPQQCFNFLTSNVSAPNPPYASDWGGSIAQNGSKQPEGKFYDGIYASGLGGVNDLRLSAHKVTAEDYARVDAEVKAGTYLGAEKLKYTQVNTTIENVSGATSGAILKNPIAQNISPENAVLWIEVAKGVFERREVTRIDFDMNAVNYTPGAGRIDGGHYILTGDTNITVSGEFQLTEVIGSPDSIIKCETLKDGWLGVWNPTIPDGNPATWFKFSRKSLVKSSSGISTKDNGLTWENSTPYIDPVKNATTLGGHNAVGRIGVYPYKAFAHQVVDCDNSPVQDGKAGLGDVFATQAYIPVRGALLAEALINKIPTALAADRYVQTLALQTKTLLDNKLNSDSIYSCEHSEVTMLGKVNNSPAVKCLDTRSAVNDQAYLDYHFKELVWDETSKSWGDESNQIPIGNKTAVMTDNNGNSVLFGTKRLTMPIGWL